MTEEILRLAREMKDANEPIFLSQGLGGLEPTSSSVAPPVGNGRALVGTQRSSAQNYS
jgi:hypothetical protein